MKTYNFSEALSWMRAGLPAKSPTGRIYRIENDQFVCYPDPVNSPKHRRIETRMHITDVLSDEWVLLDN